VTPREFERLEKGEVINMTGEDWEQTDRELAAEMVGEVLGDIKNDLETEGGD